MVQFHPFRDATKENIRGVQTLVQRRLWNFFVANYRGGVGGVGGGSPLQRANRDVPLDGVAFSRLE